MYLLLSVIYLNWGVTKHHAHRVHLAHRAEILLKHPDDDAWVLTE